MESPEKHKNIFNSSPEELKEKIEKNSKEKEFASVILSEQQKKENQEELMKKIEQLRKSMDL